MNGHMNVREKNPHHCTVHPSTLTENKETPNHRRQSYLLLSVILIFQLNSTTTIFRIYVDMNLFLFFNSFWYEELLTFVCLSISDTFCGNRLHCVEKKQRFVMLHRRLCVCVCTHTHTHTRCPRRNGQNFGRVFPMLNYTDITQNTYIQS